MRKQQKQGKQGNRQQSQQNDNRPPQGRDPQRNKQSDSGQNAPPSGSRSQQGADNADRERRQGGKEPSPDQRQSGGQPPKQNVYGEGNYAASKQYNDATRKFAKSGRVEDAARAAEPRSDADALQMQAAEAEGKRHSKGEDPSLNRKSSGLAPGTPRAPKPGEEE